MLHRLAPLFCVVVQGCAAAQETTPEATAEIVVEEAVIATAVDIATFRPTGVTGSDFPNTTRQLYLCLRVRTSGPRSVVVGWYRREGEEPFSSSRLTVTGDRWVAAEYEAFGRLEPGGYVVRVEASGGTLAEVPFEITGDAGAQRAVATPGSVSVTTLRFVRELGDDGRPRGPQTTLFPSGTTEVHSAFSISGAAPGTTVEVRWIRGSERVRTSDLGTVEGARDVQASLRPGGALRAGLYRVEVVVNGAVARSGTFTVEEPYPADGMGPRVSELALTTSVAASTGRPTSPVVSNVRGDERTLYLSLVFSRMPPDEILEVRWFDAPDAATPFAVSRFQVGGRGSLAAELSLDSPLAVGRYHVDVAVRDRVIGSLEFAVDRPVTPTEGAQD